jgi:hypothetical protein
MAQQLRLMATLVLVLAVVAMGTVLMVMEGG